MEDRDYVICLGIVFGLWLGGCFDGITRGKRVGHKAVEIPAH